MFIFYLYFNLIITIVTIYFINYNFTSKMLVHFIGDIKIIIAHIAVKCIKHFFKYMINASQWDKKARHKPTSAIL